MPMEKQKKASLKFFKEASCIVVFFVTKIFDDNLDISDDNIDNF